MKTIAPITADDFAKIAQIIGPCELVRGEIVPHAFSEFNQSRTSANASFILMSFARRTKLGCVLGNKAGVYIKS